MSYSLQIKRTAARELAAIPQTVGTRIVSSIDSLREQPLAGIPLKGRLRRLRRLRVGDYRILYQLLEEESIVLVLRVAHRSSAYRQA